MSLSCSGEQKEQFENPFEILAQLEFEISLKNHAQNNFSGKIEKTHKSLASDLQGIFLPNNKHYSMDCGGNSNFMSHGPGEFPKFLF